VLIPEDSVINRNNVHTMLPLDAIEVTERELTFETMVSVEEQLAMEARLLLARRLCWPWDLTI